MSKYTTQECLNKAKTTIRQIEQDGIHADPLCFACARIWLERAEYASRKADDTIRESEFVEVAETLYNLSNAPFEAIRNAVGRLP